ncbi:MAG: hypothetical protein ABIK92_14365 [Pseudomonadota bacterium]
MRNFIVTIICIAINLLNATSGFSHGTLGYISRSEGYLLTSEYDDGEAMSYASVEITSFDSDITFQTGRCDRNGHFMFYPDKKGQWRVVVKDGMGHRIAVNAEVTIINNESKTAGPKSRAASSGITRAEKIIMGFSIIFGIFGLWYGWKTKRKI